MTEIATALPGGTGMTTGGTAGMTIAETATDGTTTRQGGPIAAMTIPGETADLMIGNDTLRSGEAVRTAESGTLTADTRTATSEDEAGVAARRDGLAETMIEKDGRRRTDVTRGKTTADAVCSFQHLRSVSRD